MSQFLQGAFETSLGVSAIIALLLLLRPLLAKRYHAKWQYWVWLCLALRLALPFALPKMPVQFTIHVPNPTVYTAPLHTSASSGPNSAANAQKDAGAAQPPLSELPLIVPDAPVNAAGSDLPAGSALSGAAQSAPRAIDFWGFLSAIWLLGAAALFAARLAAYIKARGHMLKSAANYQTALLPALLSELCINSPVKLYQSPLCESPMLMGLLRPCIVLPQREWDDVQLAMILRHELCHYQRRDIAYKFLLIFISSAYWFNPLVWLMVRAAHEDIELSCDEAVVHGQSSDFRAAYGETLLKTLRGEAHRRVLLSTHFGGKMSIKARLSGIFSTSAKKHGALLLTIVLLFSLAAGTMIACAPIASSADFAPPSSAVSAPTQPELTDAMRTPILLYDQWYLGRDCDFAAATEQLGAMGAGFLFLKNLATQYQAQNPDGQGESGGVNMSADDCIAFTSLFTVSMPQGGTSGLFIPYNTPQPTMTLLQSETLANGDLRFTFAREYQGARLHDAVYTLREGKAENVPEIVQDFYKNGDTVYRLVKAENVPTNIAPAQKRVEIGSAQDLMQLARDINAEGWKYSGYTYVLTADIDLAGVDFTPIGLNAPPLGGAYTQDPREPAVTGFCGTLDGAGHSIQNLTVRFDDTRGQFESGYCGLFGIIAESGTVKNLTIENAQINAVGKNTWHAANAGILAAELRGNAENCHVSGKVNGVAQVGGLVGNLWNAHAENAAFARPLIMNCTADAQISGCVYAGGLVGNAHFADIKASSAKGSVTAYSTGHNEFSMGSPAGIGGFAGFCAFVNVDSCDADTRLIIKESGVWIGSFIGWANASTVKSSTYHKASTGNWKPISVIDEKAADPQNPDYVLSEK